MTNSLNQIFNEINDDEKFIKAQTSCIENLEANSRKIEESRQYIANDNINFNIQYINEINNFFNQQL